MPRTGKRGKDSDVEGEGESKKSRCESTGELSLDGALKEGTSARKSAQEETERAQYGCTSSVNNTHALSQNGMSEMKNFFKSCFDEMKTDFMTKFDSLEQSLIKSTNQRISEAVNKAVQEEIGAVRSDFDKKWSDVVKRLDTVEGDWETHRGKMANEKHDAAKIVIKNLPETEGEATKDRVQTLIVEGLGVGEGECGVVNAERKGEPRPDRRYPRVVVATLKDSASKITILKKKSKLKDKPQFAKVFIDSDRPLAERIMENNLRTIVKTVGGDKLTFKGNKVVTKDKSNVVNPS